MAIVLKWRDGKYLCNLGYDRGYPVAVWKRGQRRAMRFASREEMQTRLDEHFGGPSTWTKNERAIVRLVPRKRHAPPKP